MSCTFDEKVIAGLDPKYSTDPLFIKAFAESVAAILKRSVDYITVKSIIPYVLKPSKNPSLPPIHPTVANLQDVREQTEITHINHHSKISGSRKLGSSDIYNCKYTVLTLQDKINQDFDQITTAARTGVLSTELSSRGFPNLSFWLPTITSSANVDNSPTTGFTDAGSNENSEDSNNKSQTTSLNQSQVIGIVFGVVIFMLILTAVIFMISYKIGMKSTVAFETEIIPPEGVSYRDVFSMSNDHQPTTL